MGRSFKGTALPPEPTKLVHSGEYVCTEQKYNSEQNDINICTYNFDKKKRQVIFGIRNKSNKRNFENFKFKWFL